MSELRYNYLKDTWVIVAEERSRRPHDYVHTHHEEIGDISTCPFEYGNEEFTPPEIYAIRDNFSKPNAPNWKVRVIPNKYPALRIETPPKRELEGFFSKIGGFGAHEVIIDTPDHFKHIQHFDIEDFKNSFIAVIERIKDLSKDERIRYIHFFKNHGKDAGKSLVHSHSQIIATPTIPKLIDTQINQARKYYQRNERCYLCDEIDYELKEGSRVVYENEKFIIYCPYSSLYPFEMKIAPKFHSYDFTELDEPSLINLCDAMKVAVRKLDKALVNPPFNLILYTSPPVRELPKQDYFYNIDRFNHWYIEILPRITILAGFELGTGYYINPTVPEEAAKFLREVIL